MFYRMAIQLVKDGGEIIMGFIYLLRHGETDGNRQKIFRGHLDLSLNEHGKKQAENLVIKLRDKGIKKIFSSPLKRAVETITPLSRELGIEIIKTPAFDDINVGKWQGLSIEEVEQNFPNLFSIWKNSPDIFKFPHGESLQSLRERSYNYLVNIATENDDPILVVTHQVVTRVLLLTLLEQSLKKYWSLNQVTACINVLEFTNGNFIIHSINSGYLEQ